MSKQEVSLEAMEKIVEKLPFGNYINVAKHVTYDVLRIVEHLIEERQAHAWVNILEDRKDGFGDQINRLLYDEIQNAVMERVEEYAKDDFSCGWGHEVRLKDLVFTDEHGEEII